MIFSTITLDKWPGHKFVLAKFLALADCDKYFLEPSLILTILQQWPIIRPIVINAASVILWDVPNVVFITQAQYQQNY